MSTIQYAVITLYIKHKQNKHVICEIDMALIEKTVARSRSCNLLYDKPLQILFLFLKRLFTYCYILHLLQMLFSEIWPSGQDHVGSDLVRLSDTAMNWCSPSCHCSRDTNSCKPSWIFSDMLNTSIISSSTVLETNIERYSEGYI